MNETQQSICTWADATFGPPVSDASIAARALVEMAELVTACVNGEPAERIGEEIADVVIVLARLGRSLGVDVVALADGSKREQWQAISPVQHAAMAAAGLGRLLDSLINEPVFAQTDMHDAVGSLLWVATAAAINLTFAIDRKMVINRARRWTLDGHGHGSHVKE